MSNTAAPQDPPASREGFVRQLLVSPFRVQNWGLIAGAFAGAFGLAILWSALTRMSILAAVVWPLNAICVVLCVRCCKTRAETTGLIAAVALGNGLGNLVSRPPEVGGVLFPIYAAVEIGVAVAAVRRLAPAGLVGIGPKQAFALVVMTAVVAPAASAALITTVALAVGASLSRAALTFIFWWTCNSLGMVMILPLGLGLTRASLARFSRPSMRYEAVIAAVATLVATAFIFSWPGALWTLLIAPSLVFATFRFGLPGAAVATLIDAIVAIVATSLGTGPIAALGVASPLQLAAILQAFLGLCWLVALPPAFLLERFAAELKTKEDRLVESQMLAADAQNRMLRYQLDPHFFFNTLTALSSLIQEGEAAKADLMVVSLSRFLRHSLQQSPTEKTSLREEIGAQERYLQIEQIRFGDRLRWTVDVAAEAADIPVPCFILQPLVENAVKHAVAMTPGPVSLELSAKVADGALTLSMSDDGRARAGASAKLGVGLENVRRRLALVYGRSASLSVSHRVPHGFAAVITIPLESMSDGSAR